MKELPLKQFGHWQADVDGIRVKIFRADEGYRNLSRTSGWCYYIVIPERIAGAKFDQLWLEPQPSAGYSFESYDYGSTPIAALEWHGGVTYYKRHGHNSPHRCVEFGCDFNHYWDQDRDYSLEFVAAEAAETLEQVKKWLGIVGE